jgi:hypothetical protein
MAWMRSGPDMSHAAKEGQPTMTDPKRTIPASVPVVNSELAGTSAAGSGTTDVSATTVGANDTALDKNADARSNGATPAGTQSAAPNQPLPTNRDAELAKYREKAAKKQAKADKKKKKKEHASEQPEQKQSLVAPGAQTPASGSAASSGTANGQAPPQQQ